MKENININKEKEKELIQIIIRQTDYTEEIAREKLLENKYDTILVIKKYMGFDDKKPDTIKSVNQEIYKQLRHRLDGNMRNYQERVEKGEAKKL